MRDEEGVFGEYDDESRIVCSRNYGIVAEYGLLRQFLIEVYISFIKKSSSENASDTTGYRPISATAIPTIATAILIIQKRIVTLYGGQPPRKINVR